MLSDLEYLTKLRHGDESGLRYFITQFADNLRFFAFKITKDKGISEEVVSETFYKFWEKRAQFHSLEHSKSFLYLVTRNACYDQTGAAYKHRITTEEYIPPELESGDLDILTKIIYVELIEQIAYELTKLPEQQAVIFHMSYLEGRDTNEICEKLGISASHVYHAKSKALASLRLIFKQKDISLYMALWVCGYLQ